VFPAAPQQPGRRLHSKGRPPRHSLRTQWRIACYRDESLLTLGAGVTPAQGSVKPTAGFTGNATLAPNLRASIRDGVLQSVCDDRPDSTAINDVADVG